MLVDVNMSHFRNTVLYLFEGKFDVQAINYNNYTIRIVDSGIQKQNYTPAYSLNHYNCSLGSDSLVSPYSTHQLKRTVVFRRIILRIELTRSVVFMSCENPVNSPFYLDTSTCIDNGEDSSNTSISHSKRYNRYAIAGTTKAKDVEDSCKVDQTTFLTPWPGFDPIISCNKLVYGFELSWLQGYCDNYCPKKSDGCYLDDANQLVHCFSQGK